ncbi:hypothetical protein Patl1_23785 [Pistacia atlantica]|uniref:Uncharacterized protein n=1 Tax=Pistacia atlantica TaxID=434234 RepID=A0ACC1A0P3_9ROSI|nr:hypothetical protein Patl1_23785 [Pistacia atlantica]
MQCVIFENNNTKFSQPTEPSEGFTIFQNHWAPIYFRAPKILQPQVFLFQHPQV